MHREGSRRDLLKIAPRFIAGARGSKCQFLSRRDGPSATCLVRAVPMGRQCAGRRSSKSQPSKAGLFSCRPCRDFVECSRRVGRSRQWSPQIRDEPNKKAGATSCRTRLTIHSIIQCRSHVASTPRCNTATCGREDRFRRRPAPVRRRSRRPVRLLPALRIPRRS